MCVKKTQLLTKNEKDIRYKFCLLTPRATHEEEGKLTTDASPLALSFSFSGRTRHTTFTRIASSAMAPPPPSPAAQPQLRRTRSKQVYSDFQTSLAVVQRVSHGTHLRSWRGKVIYCSSPRTHARVRRERDVFPRERRRHAQLL